MTISDFAAWWGAGLATLVLVWDIYKWKASGSRIAVRVSPNMQTVGDRTERVHIFVEVVNRGDKLTTLTHLGVYHYASRWRRLLRKRKSAGLIPNPEGGAGLPHELAPGKRWTGMINQEEVESRFLGGEIYIGISHTGSDRESTRRLVLKK